MIRAAIAACLLLAACAGPAATGPTAAAPAAAVAPDAAPPAEPGQKVVDVPDQAIVCSMERPTGSNIPERVCRLVDRRPDTKLMMQEELRKAPTVQRGGQ